MKKRVVAFMLTAVALSACQEKSLYDPNYNSDLGVSVPANFDWSTTKTLSVNVGVNDAYNGKYYYAVRVYDQMPGEGILPIAASGKVNKDLPFSRKIVVPATVSKLYIAQVFKQADASEKVDMQEVPVTGESVAYSFGDTKSRSASSTRAKEDEAVELKEGMTLEKNTSYYVDGQYTIESIDEKVKGVTITVNGTLQFAKSVILPNQWTIKVKDGGKLNAGNGTTLTFGNGCVLSNYGEVRVSDIEFIQGSTWYNGDAAEGANEGACFYAHTIYLQGGSGGSKRYLGERSYTACNKLELDNVKLTLKTGAWLKCDVLDALKEKGGASTLLGEGTLIQHSKYVALAMIGEIAGHLTIEDNVLVECGNVTGTVTGKVVSHATGLITITGTSCSEGGFGNEETIKLGSYTYLIEDMYPEQGDYDMNDIVVALTISQTGTDVNISGELKAVGAIQKIVPYVKIGDDTKPLWSGGTNEAHAMLSGETVSTPINTETGGATFPVKAVALKFSNVKKEINLDDVDFYIVVNDKSEVHWNTREGNVTWGIRVPGTNFKWPQERVSISVAYPELSKWFENKAYPWYNTSDPSKIYQ